MFPVVEYLGYSSTNNPYLFHGSTKGHLNIGKTYKTLEIINFVAFLLLYIFPLKKK